MVIPRLLTFLVRFIFFKLLMKATENPTQAHFFIFSEVYRSHIVCLSSHEISVQTLPSIEIKISFQYEMEY